MLWTEMRTKFDINVSTEIILHLIYNNYLHIFTKRKKLHIQFPFSFFVESLTSVMAQIRDRLFGLSESGTDNTYTFITQTCNDLYFAE